MTEQEKRGLIMTDQDKEFYKMIKAAYPLGADYPEVAAIKRLINAGYRKEEEVRKEAAREFAETLIGLFFDDKDMRRVIRDVANAQFGVEVEE